MLRKSFVDQALAQLSAGEVDTMAGSGLVTPAQQATGGRPHAGRGPLRCTFSGKGQRNREHLSQAPCVGAPINAGRGDQGAHLQQGDASPSSPWLPTAGLGPWA